MEYLDLAWKCIVIALVVGLLVVVSVVYAACVVSGEWSEREDKND
jgi:hypothetical protein